MNIQYAISSVNDIQHIFNKLNIKKLGCNEKQTEELYLILKFLLIDMKKINLTFPYTIEIKDKPDIRIFKNNYTIGIEITFAISQTLQKAKISRAKLNSNLLLEPGLYKKNMSAKDIEKSILKSNNQLMGSAYSNYEIEEEIADQVLFSIKEKIKKFKGYQVFEENLLMLYSDRLIADTDIVLEMINDQLKLFDNIPFNKIIFQFQEINFLLRC